MISRACGNPESHIFSMHTSSGDRGLNLSLGLHINSFFVSARTVVLVRLGRLI